MRAEAGIQRPRLLPSGRQGVPNYVVDVIRRIPQRVRERRFWKIQALILCGTAPHYIIEVLGFTNPFETLHGLSITLYIMPLLYASLNYGWEGAVMTALWAAFLTSPSMLIWHRSEFHWFTELAQLAITLPVGILVAWRVDLETKLRRRAERTSADLKLLNEVAGILSHTLEVEQELPEVMRRLQAGLSLESVSLSLEPGPDGSDAALIETTAAASKQRALAAVGPEEGTPDGRTLVVPLFGETGMLGSLRATAPDGEDLTDAQAELITTVAHELRVALENARLYRQRQESLQSYARQVTQAQEDERLRIARELHDEMAQELVHVVRSLERLRHSSGARQTESVDGLLETTRNLVQAVRRYSRDLRPSVLDDLGLLAAIEMLVDDTNARLPAGARLAVAGRPRRVDSTVELALFRIAQEALRNAEKHASATSATVDLEFDGDEIRLAVADDGAGFAAPTEISSLAPGGKLGLVGMKERAELVGGRFDLHSVPGEGTRINVQVRA